MTTNQPPPPSPPPPPSQRWEPDPGWAPPKAKRTGADKRLVIAIIVAIIGGLYAISPYVEPPVEDAETAADTAPEPQDATSLTDTTLSPSTTVPEPSTTTTTTEAVTTTTRATTTTTEAVTTSSRATTTTVATTTTEAVSTTVSARERLTNKQKTALTRAYEAITGDDLGFWATGDFFDQVDFICSLAENMGEASFDDWVYEVSFRWSALGALYDTPEEMVAVWTLVAASACSVNFE